MKTYHTVLLFKAIAFSLLISNTGSAQSQTNKPLIRLYMNTAYFSDETVFYFESGGSTSFQPAFDAYKLIANHSNPYLGSLSDSVLTSINGLPALPTNLDIPVKAITPASGSFTFDTKQSDFPADVCVTLFDTYTNISTNILNENYVCDLYDTTTAARFRMRFYTTKGYGLTQQTLPSCDQATGRIIAKGLGDGPWNYEWRLGDSTVKFSSDSYTEDTLSITNGGVFSLKINSSGQCDHFTKNFTVEEVITTDASFEADTSITTLSNSGRVNFSNMSSNAQFSIWDFGDKSGTLYMPEPSHNYASAGIYTVTLISESITHCKDTAKRVIKVLNDVTGIPSYDANGKIRISTLSGGNYELNLLFETPTDLYLEVSDLSGSIVYAAQLEDVSSMIYPLDLAISSRGLYHIKVSSPSGEKTFRVIR